ncbi:cytochrome b6-f complex subunit 6 [Microcoleus sp. FACHB-1515]|nr:cytochrome b6-f complex subunit PetL [Microcoleus sp. FACHB-1515]MBD2088886.1 cytochrome b6-f complex subunit 6 [Microcoleus sp. FACHB-1515]
MSGVISYFLLLGGAFGLAIGLYYALRTVKLI